jgi:hypothetical protein
MSNRAKRIIIAIAIVQILLIVALVALPRVVLAIPGRYRVALNERSPFLGGIAEGLIDQVAPVAAALPAPENPSQRPNITIPAVSPQEEPTATAVATVDSEPTPTVAIAESVEITPLPTVELEPTQVPVPTATLTPTPIPQSVHLPGMPRIQQSFNNCGPANLTQVLNWYGDDTTQDDAASYLKPNPEDRNVSPWQLSDYVNDFTPLVSTVHAGGDLDMLRRFIAAGFPVVVEKGYEPNTARSEGWFGHYLTIFGYDEAEQTFDTMDTFLPVPEETGRADPYDVIEQYWQHFNYNFYVVYRPEQEEEVHQILGPDMLDPMTMWENAAQRAQADTDADPENAFAWFNLGTSLTRLGELTGEIEFYENGAAAFDQARTIGLPPRMLWYEFRPYLAYMKVGRYDDMITIADTVLETQGGRNVEETYLYMGHALLFQGDGPGAAAAYERALELNENFYPAEIALQSIS